MTTPRDGRLRAFGAATLVDVDGADHRDKARRAAATRRWLVSVHPGVDVVAGGDRVLVQAPIEDVSAWLDAVDARSIDAAVTGASHTIDVAYDGEDLEALAARAGMSTERAIALHTEPDYDVEVVGFLPGFAYLAETPPALRAPRRAAPRPRVPAGSVAIAGRYSGVYPFASPGGWNLIGRAIDPRLFDPSCAPPTRLSPGDRVRFRATRDAPRPPLDVALRDDAAPANDAPRGAGALEILRVTPHATVQDLGRPGLRGAGVPLGGAWDRATHARANAAVGNAEGSATIELPFGGLVAIARRELVVSVDGARAIRLRESERLEVAAGPAAVRYVAVAGGVDVPRVLGSRSTLLVASLGGFLGRRLQRGDVLAAASIEPSTAPAIAAPREALDAVTSLRVALGPDGDELPSAVIDGLLHSTWTISPRLDRTGARLDGPRVAHAQPHDRPPRPTLPGAIQVTPDGTPILLGPDAAVTGGYPIALQMDEEARSVAARLLPGTAIRLMT